MSNDNQFGSSREGVAFALMELIAKHELKKIKEKTEGPREYYLDLYEECLAVVDRTSEEDEEE